MFGEYEFVEETTEQYGAEYVENLVEQGYTPTLTERGWRWLKLVSSTVNVLTHA